MKTRLPTSIAMTSLILAFALTASCSKRGRQELPPTITTVATGPRLAVTGGESRELLNVSGQSFQAKAPITLAAQVPSDLTLTATFPGAAPMGNALLARGNFSTQSQRTELLASVTQSELNAAGELEISIQITGASALFTNDASVAGSLTLDILNQDSAQSVLSLTAELRTPPTPLTTTALGIKDWKASLDQDSSEKTALLSPTIAGKQIDLVEVYRLTNNNAFPVEVSLPRRPQAKILQWTNPITYQDTGCSGQGYSLSQDPHDETLSDEVFLAAMNEQFLLNAASSLTAFDAQDLLVLTLQPQDSIDVGIYATGPSMDAWMSHGPLAPSLTSQTVEAGCFSVCSSTNCTDDGGCTCDSYISDRATAVITTGIDRKPPTLIWSSAQINAPLRFGDLDPEQDPETRVQPFFSEETPLIWLN